LRHTWATRTTEIGARPFEAQHGYALRTAQERHQADAVKGLEKAHAARQIAEFLKKQEPAQEFLEGSKTEGQPQQVN
jgi:hypothetical protein